MENRESTVERVAREDFYAALGIAPEANGGQWANLPSAERDRLIARAATKVATLPDGPPDPGKR